MTGLPYASGQRFTAGERAAPVADPRGAALLHAIRALALDEAERLESLCHDRTINYEKLEASPLAVAQRQTYQAMALLADIILRDPDVSITAKLAAAMAAKFPA